MPLTAGQVQDIVQRYPSPRSAILTLLWEAQNADGYIRPETVPQVAAALGVPASEVESVLSFYTMFRRTPPARCRLQICRSLACAMKGAEEIAEQVRAATGVGPGQDGGEALSVEYVECIAACDHAPAYLFNERMSGPLTTEKALRLLRGEEEAGR